MKESTNGYCTEEASLHSMVFATAPDDQSAKKIARGLVANKLAACVTIVPRITSIYAWEGEVIEDPEVLLMMKTRTSRLDELTQFVVENHPYRVAEVLPHHSHTHTHTHTHTNTHSLTRSLHSISRIWPFSEPFYWAHRSIEHCVPFIATCSSSLNSFAPP